MENVGRYSDTEQLLETIGFCLKESLRSPATGDTSTSRIEIELTNDRKAFVLRIGDAYKK